MSFSISAGDGEDSDDGALDLSNGGACALLNPLGIRLPSNDPQEFEPAAITEGIDKVLALPEADLAKLHADLLERGLDLDETYGHLRGIAERAARDGVKVCVG